MSAEQIRKLNDTLRQTMPAGQVMFTSGVAALPSDVLAMVVRKVATFNEFNGDNDPYGEHDCAMFEVAGQKFMFKIDYYDKDIKYGSEDPASPEKTTRIMTIMRAEDY